MRAVWQGGWGEELAHPPPLRGLQGRGGGPGEGQAGPVGGRGHAAHRQVPGPPGLGGHDHSRRLEAGVPEKIRKLVAKYILLNAWPRIYELEFVTAMWL